MTPQEIAKSIADGLREHPERWTKDHNARDALGNPVQSHHKDAASWCILGHIRKRLPQGPLPRDLKRFFSNAVGGDLISSWNDEAERTVVDVIALCDKIANS